MSETQPSDEGSERAQQFEAELRALFPRWRECVGLGHGRVPQLIASRGAIGAVKHLLSKSGLSAGFIRLHDGGCLDATIEYLVLRREFGSLFTPEERAAARRRLTENGLPRSALPLEPYQ
jgi:hypothetical protein